MWGGPSSIWFLFGFVAVAVGMFPVQAALARCGVVDRPNARSSHTRPTVRGGGVAIIFVVAPAFALAGGPETGPISVAALLGLAAVSFIDDLQGVTAAVRFAVQVGAAAAFLAVLSWPNGTIPENGLIFAFVAWVWITGYTNAFNFMDGINGIAGLQALITGLGTAVIAVAAGVSTSSSPVLIAMATAGSALGFLPHNFPRARVFMGDVGSAPLGFVLAGLAVWIAMLTSWWMLFWLALLHANFVLDTAITLVRRAMRRERLLDAHREHFYQRLVRSGWSHTRTSLTVALLQTLTAFALWTSTTAGTSRRVAVATAIVGMWLLFFWFAETRFRGSGNSKLAT